MLEQVSLILPVLNGERTLKACLDSVFAQDFPLARLEVIVVDNGSSDRTKEIINAFPVKYVFLAKPSIPAARNAGIQAARGEIIAFTDCDCVLEENWLARIVEAFDAEKVGAVGGKILTFPSRNAVAQYIDRKKYKSQYGQQDSIDYFIPWIATGNAAFRRSILEKLGGFDTAFTRQSDVDLTTRIVLAGYEIKYCETAIIFHQERKSVSALWKWRYQQGKSVPKLFFKYRKITKRHPVGCLMSEFFIRVLNLFSFPKHFLDIPLGWIDTIAYCAGHIAFLLFTPASEMKRISHSAPSIPKVLRWNRNQGMTLVDLRDETPSYYSLNFTSRVFWKLFVEERMPLDRALKNFSDAFAISLDRASQDTAAVLPLFSELRLQLGKEDPTPY